MPSLSKLSLLSSGSPLVIAFSEWKLIRIRRWRGTSRPSVGLPFSNPLQVACRLARAAQAYLKAIHTRAGARLPNSGQLSAAVVAFIGSSTRRRCLERYARASVPLAPKVRARIASSRWNHRPPLRSLSLSFDRGVARVIECTRPACRARAARLTLRPPSFSHARSRALVYLSGIRFPRPFAAMYRAAGTPTIKFPILRKC